MPKPDMNAPERQATPVIVTGAVVVEAVKEVGGVTNLGTFRSPAGDLFGLIETPGFSLRQSPRARAPAAEPTVSRSPSPLRTPDYRSGRQCGSSETPSDEDFAVNRPSRTNPAGHLAGQASLVVTITGGPMRYSPCGPRPTGYSAPNSSVPPAVQVAQQGDLGAVMD
jgi:hypothetical protein